MLAYLVVLLAVAVRFMPHPLAFTPVMAALLYFGARGSRRQIWVPLALLAASDVVLTKLVYAYPFSGDHFVTWAWYAAILWLGTNLRENTSLLRVGASALAGSVSFFVVSNLAVWASWNMYPKVVVTHEPLGWAEGCIIVVCFSIVILIGALLWRSLHRRLSAVDR